MQVKPSIFFLTFFFSVSSLNIQIFTSEFTSANLTESLNTAFQSTSYSISTIKVTLLTQEISLASQQIDIALDLTSSLIFNRILSLYCEDKSVILLTLDSIEFISSRWKFCAHSALEHHADSLVAVIDYLNWQRIAMLTGLERDSRKISKEIGKKKKISKHLLISSKIDSRDIESIIGKELKSYGYKQTIIIGTGELVDKVIAKIISRLIYSTNGILLSSTGIWANVNEKTLIVVESGLEKVKSSVDYDVQALLLFFRNCEVYIQNHSSYSTESLRDYIETISENHLKSPDFSIINVIDSQRILIGNFSSNKLYFSQPITFPTVNPDNSLPKIRASASFYNPAGFPNATGGVYLQTGAVFAAMLTSMMGQQLKYHNLDIFLASCGSEFFIHDYNYYCWAMNYQHIGLFYIASPIDNVVQGELGVFKELGIMTPVIGGIVSAIDLSNTTTYPTFTRSVPSIKLAAYLANFFNSVSWSHFNIIFTNTTRNLEVYYGVLALNLNIVNSPDNRAIPEGYNRSMFNTYKSVFSEIADNNIRPLFLIADFPDIFNIAEAFYDVGLRAGDILIFLSIVPSSSINLLPASDFKNKVLEIMTDAIIASGEEWVGEYGQAIKQQIIAAFGLPVDYKCYSFDAMMLGINAVDYILLNGGLYEDPVELNKAIRIQKFTGCSGTVSIDSNSNDRKGYISGIFQLTYNNKTQSYYEKEVVRVNPESASPFIYASNFTWVSGETMVSDSRLTGLYCPFQDRQISRNYDSTVLFYIFTTFFFIYTVIMSFYLWRKWWNHEFVFITEPVEEKFGDYMVLLGVVVDLFQIIGMGPDLSPMLFDIAKIPDAATFTLTSLINFEKTVYWIGVYVVLGVVAFWVYVSILLLCKLEERLKWSLFKISSSIGITLMPIICDYLFLPIVGILLFLFDCQEGIGSSLANSYLNKDCTEFCWEGSHLTFVALAICALICFLPLAIFQRPLWQEIVSDVNIKTSPRFLVLKSVLQVGLIYLNRTVKRYHQALQGGLIVAGLLIYSIVLIKNPPFNYRRLNMWKHLVLGLSAWSIITVSAYYIESSLAYVWTSLFALGWVLFIGIGLLLQKKRYPSMLFTVKPLDITTLIKFSFTNSVKIENLPIQLKSSGKKSGDKYVIREA